MGLRPQLRSSDLRQWNRGGDEKEGGQKCFRRAMGKEGGGKRGMWPFLVGEKTCPQSSVRGEGKEKLDDRIYNGEN